ncbi:MAG: sigma-70 family RNA polymerase sigma factor [Acidimicrobiia bacterium]
MAAVPRTWEDVARDYGPMLYGVAFRLTGNESDARDLVQDTLIKVHRALHTFEPGSFSRWVYRILYNTFLDQARRRRRVRMQPLPDDISRFGEGEMAPDPETALAEYRMDDEIQRAIDELPPEFKAAVVMCDVVGLGYQEIADQTGVAIGTVRSRIHRGRAQLRARLAHLIDEDRI